MLGVRLYGPPIVEILVLIPTGLVLEVVLSSLMFDGINSVFK